MEKIQDYLIPLSTRRNNDYITCRKQCREGLEDYEKRMVSILESRLPVNYTSDYISRRYRRPMAKMGFHEDCKGRREEASRLRRLDLPIVDEEPIPNINNTRYIVSGKRSFETAKEYTGKKVAVLNYANNHSTGDAPFSAGAQEESLCRCTNTFTKKKIRRI